jgi:hypothetical protein
MLLDTLCSLSSLPNCSKYILFAPPSARNVLEDLIAPFPELADYRLLPMTESSLTSSDLTHHLSTAHHATGPGIKVFVGSDCPNMSSDVVSEAISTASTAFIGASRSESRPPAARLIPAADGGYVLLSLPAQAPRTVFDNVNWSHATTAITQVAALQAASVPVAVLDEVWDDVDEYSDLVELERKITVGELDERGLRRTSGWLQSNMSGGSSNSGNSSSGTSFTRSAGGVLVIGGVLAVAFAAIRWKR